MQGITELVLGKQNSPSGERYSLDSYVTSTLGMPTEKYPQLAKIVRGEKSDLTYNTYNSINGWFLKREL